MPIMNGLDAAKGISVISPGLPMIMFMLHVSPLLLKQAQLLGITHVFAKPDGFGARVFAAMEAMLPTTALSKSPGHPNFSS